MAVTITGSAQDTQAALLVREATTADDARICAQMSHNPMPGPISLAASHGPSFFESIEVEGQEQRVVVAERDSTILGVGLMAKRRVYINGTPADIGYISSLRTDPSIRATTTLGRGNRFFRQLHDEHFHLPFYLASILQGNALAQRVFTSGRAGMPANRHLSTLYTACIPLLKRKQWRPAGGISIVSGGRVGAEAIVECLNRCGKERQFYPVYTVEDLLSEGGVLRGLHPSDFYVALAGDRVVGVVACWNQLPFRRLMVAGYAGGMKILKPVLSPLARMLRLAPLPNPGDAVRSVMAACIAIEEDDPRVFGPLLSSVLASQYNTGKTFLMVGLMEQDPLLQVARQYVHLPTRSDIYALQWGDVEQATKHLDDRLPYVELGSL